MNRKVLAVGLAIVMLLTTTVPAAAIIWGQEDGDAHPYVGLVVFDVDGEPSHRCSGTLLTPTVFLTAGHCTVGTDAARVWFDQEVVLEDPAHGIGYPFNCGTIGTCAEAASTHVHPGWNDFASFPQTSDVGIVILQTPIALSQYGELADVGALDGLDISRGLKNQLFRIVGYGLQAVVPELMADRVRYNADPMLIELNSANTGGWNIHLSANNGEGQGKGGACFGDSGGPAFVPGSETAVAGVGSFVLNQNCVGSGFYYRVDTDYAQDWINTFLH